MVQVIDNAVNSRPHLHNKRLCYCFSENSKPIFFNKT